MNKIGYIFAFVVFTLISGISFAEEVSLDSFNEDLRWNYGINYSGTYRTPSIVSIRFDGTREYDGTIYHRLVNNYCFDSNDLPDKFGREYWIDKGAPVLFRRDEGKIFARFPNENGDYTSEYQLVDFDCKAGASFQGLSDTGIVDVEVDRIEHIQIAGIDRKSLVVNVHRPGENINNISRLKEPYPEDVAIGNTEIRIIDGIGIVGQNSFSYIFQFELPSGSPSLNVKKIVGWNNGHASSLRNVTDSRGVIIYPEEKYGETDKEIVGDEEDRIWEYASVEELPLCDHVLYPTTRYTLSSYRFDGLDIRGDRVYKNLCLKGEKTWTVTNGPDGVLECSSVVESEKNECVGKFRSSNGNLYMLPEESEISFTRYPYTNFTKRPLEDGEDILIYPIAASVGDLQDLWFDGYTAEVCVNTVKKVDDVWRYLTEVEIVGADGKEPAETGVSAEAGIHFRKVYASGVGNTGLGTFSDPKPNDSSSLYGEYEPRIMFNNMYWLHKVYGNWVTLYKGADLSPESTSSVGKISIDDRVSEESDAVYDLCGRKVLTGVTGADLRNLPKGIYIYKGRKIII